MEGEVVEGDTVDVDAGDAPKERLELNVKKPELHAGLNILKQEKPDVPGS